MDKLLEYAKAVVAAIGGIVLLVQQAIADEAISFDEASGIVAAVIAALTVAGVAVTKNRPAPE